VLEAFVEHHRDVRAEHALDADRLFRRQHQAVAVDGRGNCTPSSESLRMRREAEDLEASGVRQQRPLPSMKPCSPPCFSITSSPGRKPQVERVAEHDLRADLSSSAGDIAFTGPVCADRHERRCLDVSRAHSVSVPLRAAPSR
jgi:hypothetical protein